MVLKRFMASAIAVVAFVCMLGCTPSLSKEIRDYGCAALDSIDRYEAREIDKEELQSRIDYLNLLCDEWCDSNEATTDEISVCFEIDTLTTANRDESMVAKYAGEKKEKLREALGESEASTADYIEKGYIEWLAGKAEKDDR